ncbi:F0F1 ATP synthase subunit epsilon [Gordonia jinhuaensis]|uniref:ATP synthase epsilon chain n=1 Tax=Gordonia jinhuaensis TaxID=1517702 RepID=A0A916WNZ8_9ACTN|nr:F0F1 ATP synthase subunit epsilon [Gordonia jinhuaensis]GGB16016.1 ATP synthase epsilon chain [Gordonia jinhuaensis]
MADGVFAVDVVSVEERLYEGEATFVIAQTTEGELGVLASHEPLFGELNPGGFVVIDEVGGNRLVAAVHGGFLSVTGEKVTVLAEAAEWASSVDAAQEREVLESAEEGSPEYERALSRLRAVEMLEKK